MKGRRRRAPWRDNVEAMTMAIVMALLLKHFIVEAYKIPTGSMQPTLIGDEKAGIFDRILVDKLTYRLRDPKRWEVVIFRYPLDRSKNFVKRIAGLGPEDLKIDWGDVWTRAPGADWRIARRPRAVQRETWKAVDEEEPAGPSWAGAPREALPASGADASWGFRGRTIEARGDGRAQFRPDLAPIRDRYLDGYPEELAGLVTHKRSGSGAHMVGDLRVEGTVRASDGTRWVELELQEDEHFYRFRIPGPAAPEGARPAILDGFPVDGEGLRVEGEPIRLPAGRRIAVGAQNLDDLLELDVDGRVVCSAEIESSRVGRSSAFVSLEGDAAAFEDLMVYRDIYYTPSHMGSGGVHVPAGYYFMLGDNTQDSSDSREWILARYELPGGRVVRGNARRGENPRTVGPGDPEGPKLYFRDEWGETHRVLHEEAAPLSPESAPLVARAMIQGKAVAVFWPLFPRQDVYRLKWVR